MTMPHEEEGGKVGRSFQPEEQEQDRALWDLLSRARRPEPPSPYFARRVLREVALWEEGEEAKRLPNGGGGSWWQKLAAAGGLRPRVAAAWSVAVVAAALALTTLFAVGSWRQVPARAAYDGSSAVAVSPVAQHLADAPTTEDDFNSDLGLISESISDRDLAVIADLDDLLDTQENRAWLDDDSAS